MKKKITPEEFTEGMRKMMDLYNDFISHGRSYEFKYDVESLHVDMDNLLCEVLTNLGYGEGVKIFKAAPKWYP